MQVSAERKECRETHKVEDKALARVNKQTVCIAYKVMKGKMPKAKGRREKCKAHSHLHKHYAHGEIASRDGEPGEKREITVAIFINCMLEKRLVIASPSRKRVTMLTPTKQNFEFVIERYRMKRSTSTLSTKQKQEKKTTTAATTHKKPI